jgi:Mrp family chromosome partitioning ATPase
MGRMLDVFKQERSGDGHQKEAVAEEASGVSGLVPQDESAQQAIPFIEVGTGAAGVDASADVRALMDQAVYPIRLAPILSLHRPHDPAIPKAKPFSRTQSVTFRPLPSALESKRAARKRWWVNLHQPESHQAGELRALLDDLGSSKSTTSSQAWLFTSLDRERSTSLLLKLALTAADKAQSEVVVIDAKGRKANLGETLGLPEAPGLFEFLRDESSLEEVTRDTGYAKLAVITAGLSGKGLPVGPLGLTFHHFLGQVRQRFGWVFLDAGNWRAQSEVALLASFCDAVYLVMDEDEAENNESIALAESLCEQGIILKGSLLVPGTKN